MATLSKRQRLDAELIKQLNERDFKKASTSLKNYAYKYGNCMAVKFLEAEMKTEELFSECQGAFQVSTNEATVNNLEKQLTGILSTDNEKECLFKVYEESRIVLMKLHLIKNKFDQCLSVFKQMSSDSLKNIRRCLLIADAFAMKGICLEKENSNNIDEAIECYETAAVYLLRTLTDSPMNKISSKLSQKSYASSSNVTTVNISPILFSGLNRLIILLTKKADIRKLISILRVLLKACKAQTFGAQNVRQLASYSLASTLSKNVSKSNYEAKIAITDKFSEFCDPNDDYVFVHETLIQEMVLVLQISETMLNLDPLLDMSPAFAKARSSLLQKADCMYNQTVITLLPLGFQSLVLSGINPSLKYTFDHHHIWQLYSLIMCQSGQQKSAIAALEECYRIDGNPHIALTIAKKNYELDRPDCDRGIELSQQALKKMNDMEHMSIEKSRAWLSIGLGKALKARSTVVKELKKSLRQDALSAYGKAHELDRHDPTPILFSALELAEDRKIKQSFSKVKQALHLDPEYLPALHLIALLLTSEKQYADAKVSVDKSLDMYPKDTLLLSIKCHIELALGYKESALQTCLEFFKLTSTLEKNDSAACNIEEMNGSVSKYTTSFVKGDKSSDQQSTILGICGKTTCESRSLTKAWLLVAEVYLKCDRYEDVEDCLNEALTLNPLASSIFVIRGRLRELEKNYEGALHLYNLALTSDPTEMKAVDYLSDILFVMGNSELAENLLRNAAAMDITSHTIWFKLGKVMENNEDYDNAMQCFTYALHLEETCPIVPFTSIDLRL